LDKLPKSGHGRAKWGPLSAPKSEGLTFPAKVNFVGKGANLKELGFKSSGATAVAVKHLNTGWLWDKVRVQGGAYGGSSSFDPFSGGFTFTSYRDPNLTKTIDAYDAAAQYLDNPPTESELTRSIIGVIGSIDTYRLPDAKGFTALMRELSGDTEEDRQRRREEVLGAGAKDFKALGGALSKLASKGQVVVLGSEAAIKAANDERGNFLEVTRVL
jgi:Zn-dependent M16 (insulinase) family peptidase